MGLSNLLSDPAQLNAAMKNPGISNLRVITGGAVPNDPAALLGSRRAEEFVRWLREAADFAIIDTPPVLAVADASILAPLADGVVFVLNADQCSRSALIQARDQLENAGAGIIGAVLLLSLFDWALIVLSAVVGAYLIESAIVLPTAGMAVLFVALAIVGVFVQAMAMRTRQVV